MFELPIIQYAGELSRSAMVVKPSLGAVNVTVTVKVWLPSSEPGGSCLIQFAGPGGIGVGVGVGVTSGVGVGVTSGVGVGVTSGVGVGLAVGVGVGVTTGVGVGVGITLSIYRSTHVNPPSANKTVA